MATEAELRRLMNDPFQDLFCRPDDDLRILARLYAARGRTNDARIAAQFYQEIEHREKARTAGVNTYPATSEEDPPEVEDQEQELSADAAIEWMIYSIQCDPAFPNVDLERVVSNYLNNIRATVRRWARTAARRASAI